jgi:aminoglycoside 6-adenylyltransferase
MDQIGLGYEGLIQRFVSWAQTETDIRAAMVIGSRARVDHPADEWSDLDIVIYANTPQRYIASVDWIENIGVPWLTFVECTPDGGWERRVLFADGFDVDFAIDPVQSLESMVAVAIPSILADILRRGFRILSDKDGFLLRLQRVPIPEISLFQRPTENDFLNTVNDFWYHTVWTAKHLRRGELWWAKSCCDVHLKVLLRQALEWHARAMNGQHYDTWMSGRFLEEWADPRAIKELPNIFSHYQQEDIGHALWMTMDLFRWLAIETAQRWGYTYPTLGDQSATVLVKQLLFEMN